MITESSCFVYASFQRRMVAYLIDSLLLGMSVKLFQHLLSLSHLVPVIVTGGLLLGGLRFLYAPFCHARWGQTLGKRVMKIKVTGLSGCGICGAKALLREIFYLPGFLYTLGLNLGMLLAYWGFITISYSTFEPKALAAAYSWIVWGLFSYGFLNVLVQGLFVSFHPKKRALHDILAGTVVLDVRVPEPAAIHYPVPCLQCGGILPPTQSQCPNCGWTYEA